MATNSAFTPFGLSASVNPTTSTAALALTLPADVQGGFDLRVCNNTDVTVFVTFGTSTATAVVATGIPIPSGAIEVYGLGPKITHMAHIVSATATGSIYTTAGVGV
jgi:hypothetical protein